MELKVLPVRVNHVECAGVDEGSRAGDMPRTSAWRVVWEQD
jgi:hypothetical protein